MIVVAATAAAIVLPMLIETWVSSGHDRTLRAQGAVEPSDDVYRGMAIAYPGAFVLLLAEGAWRGVGVDRLFVGGLLVFAAAKALKYWAIATLGPRWTFRVLVPPRSTRTGTGPYRWVSHPNYIAVAGELAGAALAMHALVTGPIAVAGFGLLMLRRIGVEERALRAIESPP
jgi:methyltransferase